MTSHLPPELWFEIFSFAVHIPTFFDVEWNYSPEDIIWDGAWAPMKMEWKSLQTRRAITCVSRDWCRLGRSFIFESLAIEGREAIHGLLALFENSTSSSNQALPEDIQGDLESEMAVKGCSGQWVKRIEITADPWLMEHEVPHLAKLLRLCSNVRIISLTAFSRNTSPFPLIRHLINPQTLPALHRVSVVMTETYAEALFPLFNRPNQPLDLVWVALPVRSLFRAVLGTGEVLVPTSLAQLSVLEVAITDKDPGLPAWPLPSLRYLSLGGLTDTYIAWIIPFMQCNGPQLLGLSLSTRMCRNMYKLLEHMPALRSLVLDDVDLSTFQPPQAPTYSSITHIGIANMHYNRVIDIHSFQESLSRLLPRYLFPSLNTIRILADEMPQVLKKEWKEPIELATQYGIRLENRERCLLQHESEPPGVP